MSDRDTVEEPGLKRRLRTSVFAVALVAPLLALGACTDDGDGDAPTSPPPPVSPPPTSSGFSISGTLSGNPFFRLDGDVNDPFTTEVTNDATTSAQPLAVPATVKGYVTATATNDQDAQPADRFQDEADQSDFYAISAQAGQAIVLDEFEEDSSTPAAVDLDLVLYDSTGTPIAVSEGVVSTREMITVDDAGDYFVEVFAFSGEANYTLTLNSTLATSATYTQTNLADLAPGRIAVASEPTSTFGESFMRRNAEASSVRANGSMVGAYSTSLPMSVLSSNLSTLDADGEARSLRKRAAAVAERLGGAPLALSAEDDAKLATLDLVKSLNRAEGRDVFVAQSYPRTMFSDPDPNPFLQWNLIDIEYELARTRVAEGGISKQPVIAVIDSGVFGAHPEIAGALIDERDFVPASVDGDGFDASAEEDVDPNDPEPGICHGFHGTHVASTATAPSGNGGIVGAAPTPAGASLIAIKLGFSTSPFCDVLPGDLAGAIRYAAGLNNPSGALPPTPADVINLSLGAPTSDPSVEAAVEDALAAGVIIVAAAGNDGGTPSEELPSFPAALDGVIAVGATNLRRERAPYSSFYPEVAIAAPGGDGSEDANGDGNVDGIVAAVAFNTGGQFEADFGLKQGTSMATPHVAAGFATMKAISPNLSSADANALLANGDLTIDLGPIGKDNEFGYGLMSLPRMVEAAYAFEGGDLDPPATAALSASPSRLDFGQSLDTVDIEISKIGDADLSVTSISGDAGIFVDGQAWLQFDDSAADADGLGTYTFVADRSLLGTGAFQGSLTFEVSGGTDVVVPVSLLNLDVTTDPESAAVFFILFQRDENDELVDVGQTNIASGLQAGGLTELFPNVAEGEYQLIFGTDMDNDGFIGDQGELFGSFPSRDSLDTEFTLSADITNLDLVLTDLAPTVTTASVGGGSRSQARGPFAIDRSALAAKSAVEN